MSTVSQGSPTRAMNRAAAMLPKESQVPIWGFPARNARLTGFSFNSVPHHRRVRLSASEGKALARPEFRTSRPEGQDGGPARVRCGRQGALGTQEAVG